MSSRVVTFGEIMMRLSPPGYQRFSQAGSFDVEFGGGEANVAVSLAQFGADAAFVTKVPCNPLGDACINEIRKWGVDTGHIARSGDRLGIYFYEKGASQRASNVVYDRAHSSISEACAADFDWGKIFSGAGWFHFTGITPALSDGVADITRAACEEAKKRGLIVSCDLNYRKKLWSKDKAGHVMGGLMKYVDLLIANEEDSEAVFGIKAGESEFSSGRLSNDGYRDVCVQLAGRFGLSRVAVTLRESISASVNNWSGMLYNGKEFYFSKKYNIAIVDRVGGGDSFGAGLIYSLMNGSDDATALEFAVAASALKHTIEGDFNMVSVDEVRRLVKGDGSGRVQR